MQVPQNFEKMSKDEFGNLLGDGEKILYSFGQGGVGLVTHVNPFQATGAIAGSGPIPSKLFLWGGAVHASGSTH